MRRTSRFGIAVAILACSVTSTWAQDENQLRRAIAGAVAYLKRTAPTNSPSPMDGGAPQNDGGYEEGPAALAGIALMEAGVPADDPVIVSLIRQVRNAAIKQYRTYQLSLDIIFLDKIGDPVDTQLIQSMGIRLLVGQSARAGWSYYCPNVDDQEHQRLKRLVEAAGQPKKSGDQVGADIDRRPTLSADILDILAKKEKRMVANTNSHGGGYVPTDDNSNTQFAILALWASRRHGLPVDDALAAVEKRFAATQDPSGGWSYVVGGFPRPTPPMTCVGLLAFAVSAGSQGERILRAGAKPKQGADAKSKPGDTKDPKPPPAFKSPLQNPRVQAGLRYLSQFIVPPKVGDKNTGGSAAPSIPGFGHESNEMSDLYFLWSLERVCMVFSLKDLNGRDWYAIGANYLIAAQLNDGSWRGKYMQTVDTCFALMFLCRSNVVKDLTHVLRTKPKLPDIVKNPPADVKPGGGTATPNKPDEGSDVNAAELTKALVAAAGVKQAELLAKLVSEKGAVYTSALVDAIPQLSDDMKKKARDGLAERMGRMSAATLEAKLQDENPEIRRAAAYGVYYGEKPELIANLISALCDKEEVVVQAARRVLREFANKKDFGPPAGASDDEKKMAAAAWTAWHKEQKK